MDAAVANRVLVDGKAVLGAIIVGDEWRALATRWRLLHHSQGMTVGLSRNTTEESLWKSIVGGGLSWMLYMA